MTENFVRVASTDELAPGQMMRITPGGRRLLLVNADGEYFATDEMCTHEDASLYLGCIQGEYLKCPLHGSRFHLRTGAVQDEPADEDLRTYPVRIDGREIFVDIGE